jgi:hypothetical protein
MAANKINKDKVLQLIKEEAYILTRKREIYEDVKKIEEELKDNENKTEEDINHLAEGQKIIED